MKKENNDFKKSMLIFFCMALMLGCIPMMGFTQDQPTQFAIIDFMKVKPENETKYLDIEKTVWKPLHQQRINQGNIIGWTLYRVLYTGTDDPYNYVTVTFFDNPAMLEDPWVNIDPSKILKGQDTEKLLTETRLSRDLVKSNLTIRQDEVVPENGPGKVKYIQVDYMKVKPGNDAAYLDVEKNIWKPIHKEFINAGSRVGWSLWSEIFPSGTGCDYQYVTANYFSDFSKIGMADYNAAFNKAHAGKNMAEMDTKTMNSRDLVRSELWQEVDEVMKQ